MQFNEFKDSLQNTESPSTDLSLALQALWYAGKDQWDAAHDIIQSEENQDADWVHAHLHRQEGDLSNAGYWYRRAERVIPADLSIEAEWGNIVAQLLSVED